MLTLTIIDSLSLPGSGDRTNEDQMGWTAHCAFVIDGATGLGPDFVVGRHDSDAAWLATFAKVHFEEMIAPGRAMADIVRSTNALARRIVTFAANGREVPAWNLPVAGFQMVRIEDDAVVTYGLGDCTLYLRDAAGRLATHSPLAYLAGAEKEIARETLERCGGLSKMPRLFEEPALLARQRAYRGAYNTESTGIWTLGPVPAAADHLVSARLSDDLPLTGLLCSDGFAALVENYGRYDAGGLLTGARRKGLAALAGELRAIERVEDPDGLLYPRMKPSDDATAVLFEIATAAPHP
ncbi:MAG: hypothetical protein Kow0026_27940 [Oricola sp.]